MTKGHSERERRAARSLRRSRGPVRQTPPSRAYPNPEGCTCAGHIGIHSTVGCMRSGCDCTRGAL